MSNSRAKIIWAYVLLSMLSHALLSLFTIINGIFVGNSIYPNVLGIIELVTPFVNAISALMMPINVDSATIFAVQIVKKDTQSATKAFCHGMLLFVELFFEHEFKELLLQ